MAKKRSRTVNPNEQTPIGEDFDQAVAQLNETCETILAKIQQDFESAYPGVIPEEG